MKRKVLLTLVVLFCSIQLIQAQSFDKVRKIAFEGYTFHSTLKTVCKDSSVYIITYHHKKSIIPETGNTIFDYALVLFKFNIDGTFINKHVFDLRQPNSRPWLNAFLFPPIDFFKIDSKNRVYLSFNTAKNIIPICSEIPFNSNVLFQFSEDLNNLKCFAFDDFPRHFQLSKDNN